MLSCWSLKHVVDPIYFPLWLKGLNDIQGGKIVIILFGEAKFGILFPRPINSGIILLHRQALGLNISLNIPPNKLATPELSDATWTSPLRGWRQLATLFPEKHWRRGLFERRNTRRGPERGYRSQISERNWNQCSEAGRNQPNVRANFSV